MIIDHWKRVSNTSMLQYNVPKEKQETKHCNNLDKLKRTHVPRLVKMSLVFMVIITKQFSCSWSQNGLHGHNHKMGFDDEHGQYPPPARKERFVNNIDTSTRKVSKLNLNFRICKLWKCSCFFLAFVGFISKLKLCVLQLLKVVSGQFGVQTVLKPLWNFGQSAALSHCNALPPNSSFRKEET